MLILQKIVARKPSAFMRSPFIYKSKIYLSGDKSSIHYKSKIYLLDDKGMNRFNPKSEIRNPFTTVSIKATSPDVFHWFEHHRIMPGIHGSFQFLENEEGVDVHAEVRIGWNLPFIGRFIDIVLNLLFSNIVNDLRQHMSEEGVNLRSLLERRKSANENVLPNAV